MGEFTLTTSVGAPPGGPPPAEPTEGCTLSAMRAELTNLMGTDLQDAEANRLLDEGHITLCVRSGWTRKAVDLGPTVAGEHAYPLPDTVNRPLRVYVDGRPYERSSEVVVVGIRLDELRQRAYGHWYIDHDENGAQVVVVNPTPGTSGLDIHAPCVVYPPSLATAPSAVPPDFCRAIVNYAAAVALGGPEDNIQARDYYMNEFQGEVIRLRQHRIARTGSGTAQVRIAGWT